MKQLRTFGISLILSSFVLLSGVASSFAAPKLANAAPVKGVNGWHVVRIRH